MRTVIRTVVPGAATSVGVERPLDVEALRIGRGTDQHVLLNDLHVALAHAEISLAPRGPYLLTLKAGTSIWVNGAPSGSRRLDLGDQLEIGRYRLTLLEPGIGTDLLLAVEEKSSAREAQLSQREQHRLSLRDGGLSLRRSAWWLGGLVLLFGLLLPAALRYGMQAERPPDHVWNPGPVSQAHSHFGADCKQCHGQAFEPVTNTACLHCHTGIAEHSAQPERFQVSLAGQSCQGCHAEHNGPQGLVQTHPGLCTDCHAGEEQRFAAAGLDEAAGFSQRHPVFRPRVPVYSAKDGLRYQRRELTAGARPREQTNLKFPHDLHLDARGIDAPSGRRVLDCASCHVPDAGGLGFQPIRMEPHCLDCHRLDFDPAQPGRELPHGKPEEVVQIIRDYYAARSLHGDSVRFAPDAGEILQRRPGMPRPAPPLGIAGATSAAEQAIQDVFDRRVCRYCHVVEKTADPQKPWSILPTGLAEPALLSARFDHGAHKTETCASCHGAAQSKDSADLLLPTLEDCRSCHGDGGHRGEVPSTCSSCHRFHSHPPQAAAR